MGLKIKYMNKETSEVMFDSTILEKFTLEQLLALRTEIRLLIEDKVKEVNEKKIKTSEIECPKCKSKKISILSELWNYNGKRLKQYRCKRCKFEWTKKV